MVLFILFVGFFTYSLILPSKCFQQSVYLTAKKHTINFFFKLVLLPSVNTMRWMNHFRPMSWKNRKSSKITQSWIECELLSWVVCASIRFVPLSFFPKKFQTVESVDQIRYKIIDNLDYSGIFHTHTHNVNLPVQRENQCKVGQMPKKYWNRLLFIPSFVCSFSIENGIDWNDCAWVNDEHHRQHEFRSMSLFQYHVTETRQLRHFFLVFLSFSKIKCVLVKTSCQSNLNFDSTKLTNRSFIYSIYRLYLPWTFTIKFIFS